MRVQVRTEFNVKPAKTFHLADILIEKLQW